MHAVLHALTTRAKVLVVVSLVTGLLIMHGIGMGAVMHCLDHGTAHASASHHEHAASNNPNVSASPSGHGCTGVHDASSCVASVPKWLSIMLDQLLVALAFVAVATFGILTARRLDLPMRWLWPPPSPQLSVLCISRT